MKTPEYSILITGDFCPHNTTEKIFLSGKHEKIYNNFLPVLKSVDLRITNLECPLTLSKNNIEKNGPLLKAHPSTIEGIKFGDFNILTLANNHIRDYGDQGIEDTLTICKANNIHTVGAGMNLREASKPFLFEIYNHKIAILNFCEYEFSIAQPHSSGANPLNPIDIYYQLIEAKKHADIIIMITHGGKEMFEFPSLRMRNTYRYFADLGASIIINHHTHCISGYELYNEIPIFYGLGNFIFDHQRMNEGFYLGIALRLIIKPNKKISFEIIPYSQYRGNEGINLISSAEEKNTILARIDYISQIIPDDSRLADINKKYIQNNGQRYIYNLLGFGKWKKKFLKLLKKPSLFINRKILLRILNYIECESHRDILIASIKRLLSNKS